MRISYSADFETTTDENDCRVWAWGLSQIGNDYAFEHGTDIQSFMQRIKELSSCVIYFHNLRFDSQFIIYWLLTHSYQCVDKSEARANTFNVLINGANQIYALEIIFDAWFRKGRWIYKKATIYDSLKKLPFTVKKIAKDFKLLIKKGDLVYTDYREKGHKLTEDELSYLRNDCEIVARALDIQFQQGLTKMTIGADALGTFKKMKGKKEFMDQFPVLDFQTDKFIRKAYHGGWTYVNPKFQNMDLGAGLVYDVNSLYPWAMRYNAYPVGYPIYFSGQYKKDAKHPLYVQRFIATFELKEGYLPTIQVKNSPVYVATEYLTESKEPTLLTMCNVDMDLFFEHYNVMSIDYLDGYKFASHDSLFNEYIDYWYHIKETSSGAIKQLAKLMLNNLYGKFATNPEICERIPVLGDDGCVHYETASRYTKDAVYIPVGVFVTAYARNKTIRSAQQVYDRFCYADTDSIHLVGTDEPTNIEIHQTKLGAWKLENDFVRCRFVKAKSYVEEQEISREDYEKGLEASEGSALYYICNDHYYHLNVKCAGMNDAIKEKVTYDNFHVGFTSSGKLVPKNVQGGVVLQDVTFTIKDI